MRMGRFYGVGVGPGDPELLTLKAKRILEGVDVVVAPRSKADRESIAFGIVEKLLKKDVELLTPVFPMIKDEETIRIHVKRAAGEIGRRLREGKDLAFVTLGDPLFYSTYSRILKELPDDPEISIETVPGINSISACLAGMSIPLADRDERVAILPSAHGLEGLKELYKNAENMVFMKVSRNLPKLAKQLDELGLLNRAYLIEGCGTEGFKSIPLKDWNGEKAPYLSMVIVKRGGL